MNALKKKIGALKGSVTRSLNFAETIDDGVDVELLELRLKTLEDTWKQLGKLQDKLFDFADNPNYVDSEEDLSEYELKYFLAHSVITKVIRARHAALELNQTKNESMIEQLAHQQATFLDTFTKSTQSASVSLPKINIPVFSGDYKEWPCFRDLFLGSIDQKSDLTPTQKLQYLKSYLRDEASNLIRHLSVSDANYVEAWERLRKRYDRSNLIVQSHLQDFLSVPKMTSNSVSLLRRISDSADETIRALNALNANGRDPWVIYLTIQKLDQDSREAWAKQVGARSNCTIQELLDFLQLRCDALESCQSQNRSVSARGKTSNAVRAHVVEAQHGSISCPMCKGEHTLGQCPKFVSLSIDLRREYLRNNPLCFNCLRAGHLSNKCRSTYRCRTCKSKHHTLLHSETPHSTPAIAPPEPGSASGSNSIVINHVQQNQISHRQTLLPTAIAKVMDNQGNLVNCRLLLDSGSQNSFVTEAFAQRLGIARAHARIPIVGVSSTAARYTRGSISIQLFSRFNSFSLFVDAFILGKLVSNLPTKPIDISHYNHVRKLNLADPAFNIPRAVDALLGADKLWNIILGNQVRDPDGAVIAQETSFGWVVTGGQIIDTCQSDPRLSSLHVTLDLDKQLQKFWELEEVAPVSKKSDGDDLAEIHFRKTFSRTAEGRYIVHLPFKQELPTFGDTLRTAISRLRSMERRFAKDPQLHKLYSNFMQEYIDMGHMSRIPSNELSSNLNQQFYLPHHAVLKQDSSTTKLRVVFDGSAKDSLGRSLNSTLLVGPAIQRDLVGVCLRFRRHRYVFTADVVKMFRQILVANEHTDFQRIIWRVNPSDNIQHFRLSTVTYGTACAPFLAVRVLNQLAQDYRLEYPNASQVLLNDVYVDDVMTGTNSVETLIHLQTELVTLLSKAQLSLRKWSSNCWSLLAGLPTKDCECSVFDTEGSNKSVKVLGMYWDPAPDELFYRISSTASQSASTRRTLLSDISRIFDPLGLLAPSVISFKLMFQELWAPELNLGWDDQVPSHVADKWMSYRKQFAYFEQIRIPRNVFSSSQNIELHGFSDASSVAYSAVVYARCKTQSGSFKITIIAAKTKVAPLKPISIPRLELSGALLLARLLTRIKLSMNADISKTYAWCDSEIVLHWLSSPPRRWASFVANRTSAILDSVPRNSWHHVASIDNPADCATRGVSPANLVSHELWWSGPQWLNLDQKAWPVSKFDVARNSEPKEVKREERPVPRHSLFGSLEDDVFQTLINNMSSWNRLQRVVAYSLRFIFNCREKKNKIRKSHLSLIEIQSAKRLIIKQVQQISFRDDIEHLIKFQELPKNSKLWRYSPFLDSDGLLRVGGRLKHATISYNIKHPIFLPNCSNISSLIVTDLHVNHLHVGPSETFTILRQQYWILGSRNLIRKIIHRCKICFMQRRQRSQQLMGDLPPARIQPTRPFTNTGVDYAGPIMLRFSRGRKATVTKAYIALFVCLSTKAIHLELVSDLTSDAFLAAFRRFISRRGRCAHIYCDNGTNFHGARRHLTDMHKTVMSEQHNSIITAALARENIEWHFIPPSAPHFGGLWEAGVKSVKFHLRRVIGSAVLTFEELSTVLTQIEAVLNSRPLSRLSDDDTNPLTPAHFLIGEPLTAIPEPTLETVPTNRLKHWNLLQNMIQGFWRRWHMEYLTNLQERSKWQQSKPNFKIGDIVVLKEPNLPPTHWALGRVEAVSPGADDIVRVATIKTAKGTLVRPITKMALLPIS